jgi:hypothetical protein
MLGWVYDWFSQPSQATPSHPDRSQTKPPQLLALDLQNAKKNLRVVPAKDANFTLHDQILRTKKALRPTPIATRPCQTVMSDILLEAKKRLRHI